jgi:hypothetical protein
MVNHARYVALQMAEVAVARNFLADILRLIAKPRTYGVRFVTRSMKATPEQRQTSASPTPSIWRISVQSYKSREDCSV